MRRMKSERRTYVAIDMKSFYASAECVARGLDPLSTNLVVADESRTEKTICLAVSPTLKAWGIGGRPRLFEVVQRVGQINAQRMALAGRAWTGQRSTQDSELRSHPEWAVDYIVAEPRMATYIDISAQIYGIYLRYAAPEDIHVYSIDEVFIDMTEYIRLYGLTAHELTMKIIREVLSETGITATAGIGTNMYLCKVAMDIMAKKSAPDKDGVRIAELDEKTYREKLWNHRPLTDFWRVGRGTVQTLALHGIDTMGKLARTSIANEDLLYKLFGVNAELLIDHAWGQETCLMEDIKNYRPKTSSLSRGQVLSCAYEYDKARVVVQEMADDLAMELVAARLQTNHVALSINYDSENLKHYYGATESDHYGRRVPRGANGSIGIERYTSSSTIIMDATAKLFDQIVDRHLSIRRLTLTMCNTTSEDEFCNKKTYEQLELFVDYEKREQQEAQIKKELDKERRMQEARLAIRNKFGKNAILKGTNLLDGATAKERNEQIGGHKA